MLDTYLSCRDGADAVSTLGRRLGPTKWEIRRNGLVEEAVAYIRNARRTWHMRPTMSQMAEALRLWLYATLAEREYCERVGRDLAAKFPLDLADADADDNGAYYWATCPVCGRQFVWWASQASPVCCGVDLIDLPLPPYDLRAAQLGY